MRVSQTHNEKEKHRNAKKKLAIVSPLSRLRKLVLTIGPHRTSLERPRGKKERREKKGQASPAAGKQASRRAGRQASRHARHRATTTQHDTQYPTMLAKKRRYSAAWLPERESSPGTTKRRIDKNTLTEIAQPGFPSAKAALVPPSATCAKSTL